MQNFQQENAMAQQNLHSFKEELLEKLASKKDLEKFATKKDLENFATKKDLENFASKKDLEEFATKQDLQKVKQELEKQISSLEQKVDKNSASISRLTNEVITIKEKMFTREEHAEIYGKILESLDVIIKKFDDMRIEMAAQDAKSYRLETDIEAESRRNDSQDKILQQHDLRIKKLESVAG